MGSGTWTCSGNWDIAGVTLINPSTGTVILDGVSKTFEQSTGGGRFPDKIILSGTYTVPTTSNTEGTSMTVTGTLSINTGIILEAKGSFIVTAGIVTGLGTFDFTTSGVGTITNNATTFDVAAISFARTKTLLGTGTYSSLVTWSSSGSSRSLIIGADVNFGAGLTITNTVATTGNSVDTSANPTVTFSGGNLTIDDQASNLTWTKGTGVLKFIATATG